MQEYTYNEITRDINHVKSKYGDLAQFRRHIAILVPKFPFFWKVNFFPNAMTDPTNYVSPSFRLPVWHPLAF